MLLGQLERMNGEAMVKDVDTARQVTAKILHLIQTQGERKYTHSHRNTMQCFRFRSSCFNLFKNVSFVSFSPFTFELLTVQVHCLWMWFLCLRFERRAEKKISQWKSEAIVSPCHVNRLKHECACSTLRSRDA